MTRSFLPLAIALALVAPTAAFAQAAPAAAQAAPARLASLDADIEAVRKQFNVPAIAVAISAPPLGGSPVP